MSDCIFGYETLDIVDGYSQWKTNNKNEVQWLQIIAVVYPITDLPYSSVHVTENLLQITCKTLGDSHNWISQFS
jgi:hypothetical protein